MSDCLFCRIVSGEIPSKRVAESASCVAFHDVAPQAPIHVLVVPKAHYGSLNDLPDGAVVGAMAELAVRVARELGVAETGYRTVFNTGAQGGQTVGHIHLHLLGGRALKWPPG